MHSPYTEPQFARSALVTIDMQRDFVDEQPFGVAGTTAVIPAIQRVVSLYRRRRRPIVHVVRLYLPDGGNVDAARRHLLEAGATLVHPHSVGADVVTPLLPQVDTRMDAEALIAGQLQEIGPLEWLMYKPRWGAFYATPLEQHLRTLDVSTIVFTGCNFPNCPRTSIYEASERDFRVVAIDNAISGLYDKGREELRGIGVEVIDDERLSQAPW